MVGINISAKAVAVVVLGPRIPFLRPFDDRTEVWGVPLAGGTSAQLSIPATGVEDSVPAPTSDGEKIAYVRFESGVWGLRVVDDDGANDSEIDGGLASAAWPAWSPNDTTIAYREGLGPSDLISIDYDGFNKQTLLSSADAIGSWAWNPNGDLIAFCEDNVIKVMDSLDGGNVVTVKTLGVGEQAIVAFPYNTTIAFFYDGQVYTIEIDGSNELVHSTFGAEAISVSRRFAGSWIGAGYVSYQTDGPGNPWQVYMVPFDETGEVPLGIWTTGDDTVASGFAHVFTATFDRFYVCQWDDYPTSTVNRLTSYYYDGTDKRIESTLDGFELSLGDTPP